MIKIGRFWSVWPANRHAERTNERDLSSPHNLTKEKLHVGREYYHMTHSLLSRLLSVKDYTIHQNYNRLLYKKCRIVNGTTLLTHVPYRPFYCSMGIEARCNLKCTMCPRNDPTFEEGEMPYDVFTRIIDQLPFLKGVQLSGLGEPLLHNDLFRMIGYLKERKMSSLIVTNGTLLNENNVERIIQSGLDVIHISIDSADHELYESIRIGAKLDHVKKNVRNLAEQRKKRQSKLRININSILMRRNYRDIEKMIRLGVEIGADLLNFSDMQYSFDVGISKPDESLRLAGEEEKKEMRQILEKAQKLSAELSMPISLPKLDQPAVRESCEQPWTYLVVKENGKVRPCCAIHHTEFGDLMKDNYESIWNNSNFQSFRKALLSDNIPEDCKHCVML
ncbi:MAG: radical SAM protein [archaeon]